MEYGMPRPWLWSEAYLGSWAEYGGSFCLLRRLLSSILSSPIQKCTDYFPPTNPIDAPPTRNLALSARGPAWWFGLGGGLNRFFSLQFRRVLPILLLDTKFRSLYTPVNGIHEAKGEEGLVTWCLADSSFGRENLRFIFAQNAPASFVSWSEYFRRDKEGRGKKIWEGEHLEVIDSSTWTTIRWNWRRWPSARLINDRLLARFRSREQKCSGNKVSNRVSPMVQTSSLTPRTILDFQYKQVPCEI